MPQAPITARAGEGGSRSQPCGASENAASEAGALLETRVRKLMAKSRRPGLVFWSLVIPVVLMLAVELGVKAEIGRQSALMLAVIAVLAGTEIEAAAWRSRLMKMLRRKPLGGELRDSSPDGAAEPLTHQPASGEG